MIDHYTVDSENPKTRDEWFYNICKVVASNSKCLSRKIGAVITLDKTIISTGYNGPPRGVQPCDERWLTDGDLRKFAEDRILLSSARLEDFAKFKHIAYSRNNRFYLEQLKGTCPRYINFMGFKSGEGLEWCVAGHAERNAIVNSARLGLHELKGTKIYLTCGVPCTPCLVEIINAGIEEIIVTQINDAYDQSSKYLLKESKIKIRTYDFIKE